MRKIDRLRREALRSCNARGHDMTKFKSQLRASSRKVKYASCKRCGKYVQVIEKPLPNEIDIGGTAVALNCYGR